jgi:hypothetical protein
LWRRFLEVEVPDQLFPRKNNTAQIKRLKLALIMSAVPMAAAVVAVGVGVLIGVQRLGAK